MLNFVDGLPVKKELRRPRRRSSLPTSLAGEAAQASSATGASSKSFAISTRRPGPCRAAGAKAGTAGRGAERLSGASRDPRARRRREGSGRGRTWRGAAPRRAPATSSFGASWTRRLAVPTRCQAKRGSRQSHRCSRARGRPSHGCRAPKFTHAPDARSSLWVDEETPGCRGRPRRRMREPVRGVSSE